MKAVFLASFLRDVKKVRDRKVKLAVEAAIVAVEASDNVREVPSLKRLSGHSNYYRIRIGDYRIGAIVERDTFTFVRCLHRREIYRFFP